jgi:hypothetical protein
MRRAWLAYMSEAERTRAITVECQAAFKSLAGTRELDPESGCAVYLGIMPPKGAALEQAASEKLLFDAEDAGMTEYVCRRYENRKGDAGQGRKQRCQTPL